MTNVCLKAIPKERLKRAWERKSSQKKIIKVEGEMSLQTETNGNRHIEGKR